MLEDLIVAREKSEYLLLSAKRLVQAGPRFGKILELGFHYTTLIITILSTHIHPVPLLALTTTTMAVVALCDCKSA